MKTAGIACYRVVFSDGMHTCADFDAGAQRHPFDGIPERMPRISCGIPVFVWLPSFPDGALSRFPDFCVLIMNARLKIKTRQMKTPAATRMAQLEEAIRAYQKPLFRFAALRTGSRADAEDIVQEAFLKFALAEAPVTRPKAYLFRCVANGCCDFRRRQVRHEEFPAQIALPETEETLSAESRRIESLLGSLPPEQADVIRLHTYGSLRFTEIAEVLNCPVTTVKSRFRYGIDKLKNELQH